jgi:hypothetical protein
VFYPLLRASSRIMSSKWSVQSDPRSTPRFAAGGEVICALHRLVGEVCERLGLADLRGGR